jgi:hypothetical protein
MKTKARATTLAALTNNIDMLLVLVHKDTKNK